MPPTERDEAGGVAGDLHLGQWDFINILEAPDDVTMAKVATTLASRGTLKTMTLPIIAIDDFIAGLKA